MNTYKILIKYFGFSLSDKAFDAFLRSEFDDSIEMELNSEDYIISKNAGIELGFKRFDEINENDGVDVYGSGNYVFTHCNIYPNSRLVELPFNVQFSDLRDNVIAKAGTPTQTKKGDASYYWPSFLVDNYKVGGCVITFDYDPKEESLNFIQLRDNNLCSSSRI